MINVKKDFGAVGDGVTNDTLALQNALDSLRETGGEIFFPKGVYLLTACLIFYSHQTLKFEPGATLKRGDEDQKYLLANHTTEEQTGYTACCDAVIDGATFDGDAEIEMRTTMMNTCHARNITIQNCTFRNGCFWHYIECNSTERSVIRNCVFESSYSSDYEKGEMIQFDFAIIGNYGPVEDVHGNEIKFASDETVCRDMEVCGCKFYGYGRAPAIGNHGDAPHHDIHIHDNEFIGSFGHRGSVDFVPKMYNVLMHDNIEREK